MTALCGFAVSQNSSHARCLTSDVFETVLGWLQSAMRVSRRPIRTPSCSCAISMPRIAHGSSWSVAAALPPGRCAVVTPPSSPARPGRQLHLGGNLFHLCVPTGELLRPSRRFTGGGADWSAFVMLRGQGVEDLKAPLHNAGMGRGHSLDDRDPPESAPSSQRDGVASYRPRSVMDYLFLPGLARQAARRAIRSEPPLYPPIEWTIEPDRPD